MDNALIIFVRYPKAGCVKTRLAKKIGREKAALLYRLFVEAIVARTKDTGFRRFIFYHPPKERQKIIDWLGGELEFYPQEGNALGKRLANAFQLAFKIGAKKIVAIGTDSPTIDKGAVLKAFQRLKGTQCVIGPSLDGGYYLIGLSFFKEDIFKYIRWGTNKVFGQTMNRLKKGNIRVELLDESFDIDRYKDILLLKKRLKKELYVNPTGLNPILTALD